VDSREKPINSGGRYSLIKQVFERYGVHVSSFWPYGLPTLRPLLFCSIWLSASTAFPQAQQHWAAAWHGPASACTDITCLPNMITNLWLRLRSSDLAIGAVPSWVDEIQGIQFNQGDATKQPTNSVNGVWFDGSTMYLTNLATVIPSGIYSILWVVHLQTAGLGFGGVLLHRNNGGINTDGYYLGSAGNDVMNQGINAIATTLTDAMGNTKHGDFLSIDSDVNQYCWTNGILTGHQNNFANTFTFDIIGDGSSHNAKYKGYIQELIIWTNTQVNFRSFTNSITVSNIHYYVTNTYSGISP
jgi:hypothetical protein